MEYRISIIVDGKDNASHALGSAGGALSRIGEIAAGILGADIFRRVADGILSMGRNAIQATADFQSMKIGLESLVARELVAASAMDSMTAPTLKMSDALGQAGPRAAELMKELEDISILSPFQNSTVTNTFRTAMAFGYTSEEATKYTEAILNVAAGTGATNEMLDRMGYNLAQIRMQGKITAVDVRQLAMAGFDLNGVLKYMGREMGITINDYEDFNKALDNGQVSWKQFTDLFAKYSEENFGGAAERVSRTLNGLKSTFADVFALSMPKILGPAVEKFTVFANGILDGFMKIRDSGVLEKFGEKLGDGVGKFLDAAGRIPKIITDIKTTFEGLGTGAGIRLLGSYLGLDDDTVSTIVDFAGKIETGIGKLKDGIETGLGNLRDFWDENGPSIQGAFDQIKGSLGDLFAAIMGDGGDGAESILSGLGQAFENGTAWIKDNGPAIASAIQSMADAFSNFTTWAIENKDQILGFLMGFAGALGSIWVYSQIPAMITAITGAISMLGSLVAMLGPIMLIAGVIGLLTAGLVYYGEAVLGADAANATFFQKLQAGFWGILSDAANTVSMIGQIISTVWNEAWENAKAIFAAAVTAVTSKFEALKNAAGEKLGAIKAAVDEKISPLVDVFNAVRDAVAGVIGFIVDLATKLAGLRLPPFLERHSPSPIELAFGNWLDYTKGLTTELPRLEDRMNLPTPAYLNGGYGAVDQRQINYNLGVTTSQSQDVVERNFQIMQVLANA